jgi:hypothetical protein
MGQKAGDELLDCPATEVHNHRLPVCLAGADVRDRTTAAIGGGSCPVDSILGLIFPEDELRLI